jgi:type IV secretion system protein VirD4
MPTGIPALAREMMEMSSFPGLKNKAAQFTEWNNEIAGIASTAKIQTECFDDPQIRSNMARNDFDFRDLKRKPTTVYLILPPEMMKRHSKWLRLMLTTALQASMRTRYRDEPSVLFMLDEYASAVGHLEIIDTVWSQVRKYGIQIMPVLQDLNQLKSLMGDKWETFAANAGVITSFAPNDITTAEWLSKRMGQATRTMTATTKNSGYNTGKNKGTSNNPGGMGSSEGESDGWSYSSSSNTTPIKVPFLSPEELYGMKTGYMVVISAGLSNPAPVFARSYYKMTKFDLRARPDPYVNSDLPRCPASDDGWGNGPVEISPFGLPPEMSDDGWGNGPVESFPFGLMPEITAKVQARHPSYAPEPEPDNSGWSDNDDDKHGKPFGVF